MALRLFLIYAVVELAIIVALASTIGFGWTVLLLAGTFLVGVAVAGPQIKRQVSRLRAGLDHPQRAVTDSLLVAFGTVLVAIPGLATSALGLMLLLPPARVITRPVVAALVTKRIVTRRLDYIDGEVIDVVDVDPPALPR